MAESDWHIEADDPDTGYAGYVIHYCKDGGESEAYQVNFHNYDEFAGISTLVCQMVCERCSAVCNYRVRY